MRPITLQYLGGATGNTQATQVNWRQKDFQIGMGVSVTGTITGGVVQHTFDDPSDFTDKQDWIDTGVWHTHEDTVVPGLGDFTANADGNYAFPIQGIKLSVTTNDADVILTIIQSG